MLDGWTDKKSRKLINFLVDSSAGTMFVECFFIHEILRENI
jgi:hypothetical protein